MTLKVGQAWQKVLRSGAVSPGAETGRIHILIIVLEIAIIIKTPV
jgi:hypothetical protein